MAMGIANGPNYSNRQIGSQAPNSRFIPEVWSTKLVTKLYAATFLSEIANTDYEGEISAYGDKVYIRTIPDIAINDYEKGKDLNYDTPESESAELKIDRGKYFTFTVDSVDKYQSDLNLLSDWSNDASEQMKISIDRDVLGSIYGDVAAENQGLTAGKLSGDINLGAATAPVGVTKDNVIDFIVDVGTVLDEQDVPEEGRFFVLPSWMNGMIKKSDVKDASMMADGTSALRNGRIGMIDRFTCYRSNLVAQTTETSGSVTKKASHVIAGHKMGLTFASQMTEMDTLKNPKRFGELVRGLNVFGFEVIKPEALAHLYCYKA